MATNNNPHYRARVIAQLRELGVPLPTATHLATTSYDACVQQIRWIRARDLKDGHRTLVHAIEDNWPPPANWVEPPPAVEQTAPAPYSPLVVGSVDANAQRDFERQQLSFGRPAVGSAPPVKPAPAVQGPAYLAVFTLRPEGGYSVAFPDVPEAATSGLTLERAKKHAGEKLKLALEVREGDGQAVPNPSTLGLLILPTSPPRRN